MVHAVLISMHNVRMVVVTAGRPMQGTMQRISVRGG